MPIADDWVTGTPKSGSYVMTSAEVIVDGEAYGEKEFEYEANVPFFDVSVVDDLQRPKGCISLDLPISSRVSPYPSTEARVPIKETKLIVTDGFTMWFIVDSENYLPPPSEAEEPHGYWLYLLPGQDSANAPLWPNRRLDGVQLKYSILDGDSLSTHGLWERDADARYPAVTSFHDHTFLVENLEVSTLRSYDDVSQNPTTVNYARASTATRVGNRIFAGDLAWRDPADTSDYRLESEKDHQERFRITYSGFGGDMVHAPDSFSPLNLATVGGGTSRLISVSEFMGRVMVLTEDALWVLNVAPGNSASYTTERKFLGSGAVSGTAVIETPQGLTWLSQAGVLRFNGSAVENISGAINSQEFLRDIRGYVHGGVLYGGPVALAGYASETQRLYLALEQGREGGHRQKIYVMGPSGAWVVYSTPYWIKNLAMSMNTGQMFGLGRMGWGPMGWDGIFEETPGSTSDEGDNAAFPIRAKAVFPPVQPGDGERIARIIASSVEFGGKHEDGVEVVLGVSVDSKDLVSGVFKAVQGDIYRGRMAVPDRGRTVQVTASTESSGGYVDNVKVECIPKGRIRSMGNLDVSEETT